MNLLKAYGAEHILQKYRGREKMVKRKIRVIRELMSNAKRKGKRTTHFYKGKLKFWLDVQEILEEREKVIFT